MKKKTDRIIHIIIAFLVSAAIIWIASGRLFMVPDGTVSDAFYQEERAGNADIMIIQIDEDAIDMLGPWPWSRSVMAFVLEYLNSAGDGSKPAVIGIDVLYTGEGSDPEADEALAAAAAEAGNVVVAGAAVFGTSLVDEGEIFYLQDRTIQAFEEPYPALKAAARVAHINTMEDGDAILRHAILFEDVQGLGRVDSFSRAVYEQYCKYMGIQPNPAPKTKGGFFYIPFTKQPGGYSDSISIAQILDGSIPPEVFAGKIVLIGPYAAAMQDEYRTSISHAEPMYGVEVHANLIEAFERSFFPEEVPKGFQLLLLFLISAGMMICFRDRPLRQTVPAWLLVTFGWLAAAKLLYEKGGLILHVLWVPLSVTVLFIGSVAVNYARSQLEKKRVTDTFGHYVDPAVMKQLLDQGSSALELGGKMYNIAVLFVDVRGFTSMSEALDPPTVVEIINKYLTLTTECIIKNHGTLDKFVGDCTMAFWNAPVEQEDPVYLACCAAMDMVDGSKALGEELMSRFGRTVDFGIGVNYGPAVVGNIGAPRRMDYTAIGDTVNTAARLEANAPGSTVLISRVVADMLGDRAGVTSLGSSIRLKGKAEGFEVLTLDSLRRE